MARIVGDKTLTAPVEHVFELLSDHGAYADNFRGITRSEVTREGTEENNGLGAVRAIASGPIRFEEEITAFERPNRMDYLIVKVNAPVEHQGGSIRLEPRGDGTHVLWTSEFTSTLRVGARAYEAVMTRIFARGFSMMLNRVQALHAPGSVPAVSP